MTLNEHAEAILRAAWPGAGLAHFSLAMDCNGPAVLTALQTLYAEAFDAGALAAREAGIKALDKGLMPEHFGCCFEVNRENVNAIRAIDHATLEGRVP